MGSSTQFLEGRQNRVAKGPIEHDCVISCNNVGQVVGKLLDMFTQFLGIMNDRKQGKY